MYELATYFTRHNLWSSAGILLTASGMWYGGSNSGFSWPKYLDTSKMSLVSSFSLMLICECLISKNRWYCILFKVCYLLQLSFWIEIITRQEIIAAQTTVRFCFPVSFLLSNSIFPFFV